MNKLPRGGRATQFPRTSSPPRNETAPMTIDETRATFRALHRPGEPLVMPNAWDAGSAKLFASLGFAAIATTSSGFAATLGRRDGGVSRDEAHRPHRGARRGHAAAGERRPRGLLRRRPRRRGGDDHRGRGGRRGRGLGRGLPARRRPPDPRHRAGDRPRRRGRRGGEGERAGADGAGREPDPRGPRPRRHDPPAAGVPGGRRRRALRARAVHASRTCAPSSAPSTGR